MSQVPQALEVGLPEYWAGITYFVKEPTYQLNHDCCFELEQRIEPYHSTTEAPLVSVMVAMKHQLFRGFLRVVNRRQQTVAFYHKLLFSETAFFLIIRRDRPGVPVCFVGYRVGEGG